ncbi:MAG: hypothetical protein M1269_01055 [Chloroflexi bacterium]|nr:hypothetical protein [Chloroflexota bacterium]
MFSNPFEALFLLYGNAASQGSSAGSSNSFIFVAFLIILVYQFISNLMLKRRLEELFQNMGGSSGSPLVSSLSVPPAGFKLERALELYEERTKFLGILDAGMPNFILLHADDPIVVSIFAANLAKFLADGKTFLVLMLPSLGWDDITEQIAGLYAKQDWLNADSAENKRKVIAGLRTDLKPYEKFLFIAGDEPFNMKDLAIQVENISGNFSRGVLIVEAATIASLSESALSDLKRIAHRQQVTLILAAGVGNNDLKEVHEFDVIIEATRARQDSLKLVVKRGEGKASDEADLSLKPWGELERAS